MLVCECVSIRRVCVYCIASRNWHLLFNYLSLHNASHRLRTMIIIHMSLFEPRSSLSVHQSACLSVCQPGCRLILQLVQPKKAFIHLQKSLLFHGNSAKPASQPSRLTSRYFVNDRARSTLKASSLFFFFVFTQTHPADTTFFQLLNNECS